MAEPVDPKTYYGYLFLPDKKPSKVLDALLRSIAKYIVGSIGDTNIHSLTPSKLAAFYKAVGGNYDSLLLETPHTRISWIYQAIGCQHCLLPTANSFTAPSIPALTTSGFVRWEAIQILLEPAEHVPFIQKALQDFGLKHAETGEVFPVDVPREAFPLHSDAQIDKWHRQCSRKLLDDISPGDEPTGPRSTFSPRSNLRSGYSQLKGPYSRVPRERQFADFSASKPGSSSRTSTRTHTRPPLSSQPSRRSRRSSDADDFPESPRGRRMSVPENLYMNSPNIPPPAPSVPQAGLRPPTNGRSRRHSHPRTHGRNDSSSSDSDTDTQPTSDASLSPGHSPRRTSQNPFSGSKRTSLSTPTATLPLNPPLSARHRGRSAPQIYPDPRLSDHQIPINVTEPLPTPLMPGSRLSGHFPVDSRNSPRWQDGSDDKKERFGGKSSSDWEQEKYRRSSQDNYVHSGLNQPRSGSHDSRTRNRLRSPRERDEEGLDLDRKPRRYYGEIGVGVDAREELLRR